jgi:hypothetical protein
VQFSTARNVQFSAGVDTPQAAQRKVGQFNDFGDAAPNIEMPTVISLPARGK